MCTLDSKSFNLSLKSWEDCSFPKARRVIQWPCVFSLGTDCTCTLDSKTFNSWSMSWENCSFPNAIQCWGMSLCLLPYTKNYIHFGTVELKRLDSRSMSWGDCSFSKSCGPSSMTLPPFPFEIGYKKIDGPVPSLPERIHIYVATVKEQSGGIMSGFARSTLQNRDSWKVWPQHTSYAGWCVSRLQKQLWGLMCLFFWFSKKKKGEQDNVARARQCLGVSSCFWKLSCGLICSLFRFAKN